MNVNSNSNTRDREKWHEGRKQTSEKGAEREVKCWWGEGGADGGRVICLKTCSPEAPVCRLQLSSFSFNYFLINDI
jgi:hypothetical protein